MKKLNAEKLLTYLNEEIARLDKMITTLTSKVKAIESIAYQEALTECVSYQNALKNTKMNLENGYFNE